MSSDPLIAVVAVPADPAYLIICRHALVGATAGFAVDDNVLDDLKLLLSETCSNAIVHGYGDEAAGELEIEFRAPPGEIEVTVSDRGRGFDGGRLPAENGFGLSLLPELSDRYRIDPTRPGGGAAVTFARSLSH
jgi:serine/threonine-protein kinase RsbW